jgi:putative ABC transport system permease protein
VRRTPLAWHKITHNKLRTLASLSGICFAILLMFMQLGFYDASYRSSTLVYDQMDFDAAIVSPHYYNLLIPGHIARRRLAQARSAPGVESVVPLYVGSDFWRNPQTGFRREIILMGVDPAHSPMSAPGLAENVGRLTQDDTGIWDLKSQPSYGKVEPGTMAELGNRRIDIVATYAHGAGFISPALLIVSDRTLSRLLGLPLDDVSVGLVKFQPGADPTATLEALRTVLPDDVEVWSRSGVEENERDYFMRRKPIGIMFSSGVVLAFIVGAVILYQVLASEVLTHLKEYATLVALGYSQRYVSLVVVQQATLFAVLGFVPSVLIALVLYALTRFSTNLPLFMTWPRVGLVLLLSVVMCAGSGVLVLRQLRRADPADLF